jgi:tight adherence protein B
MKTSTLSIQTAGIATSIRSLAVLLQAGATPEAAWAYLAEAGDTAATELVAGGTQSGELTEAIAGQGGVWVDVAAAWEIASIVGAPLAESLRAIAEAVADAADTASEVQLALAEPAATARLMMWLPGAGLLLGILLGFDTVGVVFGSAIGVGCVVVGLMLVFLARSWTKKLIAEAQPDTSTPGLVAELLAIALSGGTSIDHARGLVSDIRGITPEPDTERVLVLSRSAGIPAVELLRASAAQQRGRARAEGRMRAAELSTRLLIPMCCCTLPSFILLAIAPLILSVLGSTPIMLK